jgi:hypothetical protein
MGEALHMGAIAVVVLLALIVTGCRSAPGQARAVPRYIVTAVPIETGVVSRRLCVAIDQRDRDGVWWWEPGSSGCASRSTGPGVFHAEHPMVAASGGSEPIEVHFTVPLKAAPGSTLPRVADVRLVVEAGRIRAAASGVSVAAARRADLELPELPPGR